MRWTVIPVAILLVCLAPHVTAKTAAHTSAAAQSEANTKPASESLQAPVDPARRSAARVAAQHILQRREFRGVHMPGLEETIKDRITQALFHVAEKLFGSAPRMARAFTILGWGVIFAAFVALMFWLWRALRSAENTSLALQAPPGERNPALPWHVWLERARTAAASGAFRDAVHLAYWAGIAALEQRGEWKPDRARTPREYLRVTSQPNREALNLLTRDFERIWYAQQDATAADFENCIRQLERLGCA